MGGSEERVDRVFRVGADGSELAVPGDALDARADEDMTLARPDGMEGHPGCLQ
jgi:hypothetical protein